MNTLRNGAVAFLILLASATGAFMATTVFAGGQPAHPSNDIAPRIVSSVQEAQNLAGYTVHVPNTIPADMKRSTIIVDEYSVYPSGRGSGEEKVITQITQTRSNQDGSGIWLIQDPQMGGLLDGESIIMDGITVDRAVYPPILPGTPFEMLAFSWRVGDMGCAMAGSLKGKITEDVMRDIVKSIR